MAVKVVCRFRFIFSTLFRSQCSARPRPSTDADANAADTAVLQCEPQQQQK